MGRLIAVVVFVAVLVPGALLARAWGRASARRAVATAGVEFAGPGPSALAVLERQAQHGRRVRGLGWPLALAAVVATGVLFGEASVFLWVPDVLAGLLVAVVLAEATRPRPRWALSAPPRRPRRSEQISPWLLWTTRAVVAAEVGTTWAVRSAGEVPATAATLALVPPVIAWLLAEVALLRALVRPLPARGADVPVDEALRTWTAHLVSAAASVSALLPLGGLLLVAGLSLGDRITSGFDVAPVALVAAGFSAVVAGLAVAGFLVTWLRPVRLPSPALAG